MGSYDLSQNRRSPLKWRFSFIPFLRSPGPSLPCGTKRDDSTCVCPILQEEPAFVKG